MKIGDLVVWYDPDFVDGGAKLGLIVEEDDLNETIVVIKLITGNQRLVKKYQLRKADEDRRFSKKQA
tara:strand:+ start:1468 stop:1668 length:201 start_codon:yes stop_codon:yes gene_type:complete